MKYIYVVNHSRPRGTAPADKKYIGDYSTEADAFEAAERARKLLGFKDYPDDFELWPFELDRAYLDEVEVPGSEASSCVDGMISVFQVVYARELGDDITETKTIGFFSMRENAVVALERAKAHSAYKEHQDCLFLWDVELGKDHWVEGFVTGEG